MIHDLLQPSAAVRGGAMVLLLLLLPGVVQGVLAPEYYEKARREAAYHLQVRVLSVNGPIRTPGDCAVIGEIVRIFRDQTGKLKQAMRVAFTVSCSKRGDPPMVGGAIWTDYDSLLNSLYLEVFLNQRDAGYEVALWQSRIIDRPTAQPTMK